MSCDEEAGPASTAAEATAETSTTSSRVSRRATILQALHRLPRREGSSLGRVDIARGRSETAGRGGRRPPPSTGLPRPARAGGGRAARPPDPGPADAGPAPRAGPPRVRGEE